MIFLLLFDLPLFNKVTISHLWLLLSRMFFPSPRILLLFVSIVSLYSVHLLLKTANEGGMSKYCFASMVFVSCCIVGKCHTNGLFCFLLGSLLYEQLGMKAFGMAGKLAASGSITMQNIGGEDKILKCLYRQ